jgi:homoserine kinase type II
MSVYTTVTRGQLQDFLQNYAVGGLIDFSGISAGIENTNYFVDTTGGHWVLTLFERQGGEDLPYFLGLMDHLGRAGIPSARPVADAAGEFLAHLHGRPAALVQRLPGSSVMQPGVSHCRTIGVMLARLHAAGASFKRYRANSRGSAWWQPTSRTLIPRLGAQEAELLATEVDFQADQQQNDLPRGVIHADLFRDNALFQGGQLTGIIDFYYACNDVLIYDLAVSVNDWCADDNGCLNHELAQALAGAYCAQRQCTAGEARAWPAMLRAGALRFWLSRLYDMHFPRDGEMVLEKDPEPFKQMLIEHRKRIFPLPVC